jgi:hypothetical protein
MNKKNLLAVSVMVLLVFGVAGTFWAAECPEEWSRRNPLMDYVPQQYGTYDTMYDGIEEPDCRGCHGASLADRHHTIPEYYGLCTPCHPVIEDPPGVYTEHDCRAAGCHATLDNGGHHLTNESATGQCHACHSSTVEIGTDPLYAPPTSMTPYPYSCENCHWEQEHPLDGGKHIYGYQDLHHMNFETNFGAYCYRCHAWSDSPSWDPDNELLVRYCVMGCHSIESLHNWTFAYSHTAEVDAYEAVGWHVDSAECADVDPTVYRNFSAAAPAELCEGCHGDR